MFNKILARFFQLINQNIRRLLIIKTKHYVKIKHEQERMVGFGF